MADNYQKLQNNGIKIIQSEEDLNTYLNYQNTSNNDKYSTDINNSNV